jgi:CHAD domain-containing protein
MTGVEMTSGQQAVLPDLRKPLRSAPSEDVSEAGIRLSPKQPANRVAAALLRNRLTTVWDLCQEAGDPLADPEVVHRLRVATRRSLAAFSLLKPLLPRKQHRRFVRWLRNLRRAAGTARDLDVIAERLQHHLPPDADPENTLVKLLNLLGDYQVASRVPLQKWHHQLLRSNWPQRIDELTRGLTTKKKCKRYGSFVSRRLTRCGERFFATAGHSATRADDLHQIRIEGKRLRYSLELVPTQSRKPAHDRCLRSLKKMQVALGDFTDHTAAAGYFERLREEGLPIELMPLVEELGREEYPLAELAQQRFTTWWNNKRRRRLRRRFSKTLKR